jgi:hypothetical protein
MLVAVADTTANPDGTDGAVVSEDEHAAVVALAVLVLEWLPAASNASTPSV